MAPVRYVDYNGHLSVVEYLINQEADINAINKYVEFSYFI